jgi:transitional endoplasmic reticulum ATPase
VADKKTDKTEKEINDAKLRVVEALQDDAYKGIARIDPSLMKKLKLQRGDIISIKGSRETFAIVDRAYPADLGETIIRIDGITRKNAKTSIGEQILVKGAELKEAKKITIAPAQQGIMVQGNPENIKQGLLGRAVSKGDILVMGGAQQKKRGMIDDEFGDPFSDFADLFNQMGMSGLGGLGGGLGGGVTQVRFMIVNTSPNQGVIITENTEVELKPKAVEMSDEEGSIPQVTYEDIGGLTEEVKKIREMVELPLKHPEIFDKLGIEPPKGVLLYGPPGTGKTMLAKAVAGETEAHFILLNGPEIMSKFYGESEKKVREVFDEAEKNAPAIIFIDEIDSIAPKREDVQGEVERRVVSQLLTMMDGLNTRGKVVVIGATNRPNSLDPALRRPGRFDREIEVGVPDKKGRLQILKIHTRGMPLEFWSPAVAKEKFLERLKLFDGDAYEKIEKIQEEKQETESKIKLKKIRLDELAKERGELHAELISLEEESEKLQKKYEKNPESVSLVREIKVKNREIYEARLKIANNHEEIEKIPEQINNLSQKIKSNEKEIEILEKHIKIISSRQKEIKENKKILENLLTDIESLRNTLRSQDEFDPRSILISKQLTNKTEEYSSLLADLIATKLISADLIEEISIDSIPTGLESLAGKTHGFVGADISALAKEAAMAVLRRNLPNFNLDEEISQSVLSSLRVTEKDFDDALRTVRPSAMREVLVETPNVKWLDVGGIESAKMELKEAVEWPMKNPASFERMGIKAPKGVLLYGPPGTGKTMLAKAVANESEANFIQVKGPELLSMWVGKSEEGVRKIFEKARQVSPCIIFFDEIDSLAGRRGMDHGGNNVTERVLNQMLAEMDGIETLKNVTVIGATNRPDMLDPALLRPGRFDRIVYVNVPEKEGRLQILKIHTKNMPLDKDVNLEEFAEKTEGYTGADIEGLAREAAMLALRENTEAKVVSKKHFEKAMDKVLPSVTKNDQERYRSIEKKYLRSAKSALPETSYAG